MTQHINLKRWETLVSEKRDLLLAQNTGRKEVLPFSTSLDAAWTLICSYEGSLDVTKWPVKNLRNPSRPYSCSAWINGQSFFSWGTTPMEAICLVILLAHGILVEEATG